MYSRSSIYTEVKNNMAHYKILGQDPYWMNFYGLMILTLIEVLAVGADLDSFAESVGTEEKVITLWILTIIAIPSSS
ncbi:MAG: hypothetical protein Ct9H90mP21_1690 [Methanobacteriota archaeon]|nr:MAG: hypothetical protein Ct9H90mP21_1690 [Euryarchaeota archaeon]